MTIVCPVLCDCCWLGWCWCGVGVVSGGIWLWLSDFLKSCEVRKGQHNHFTVLVSQTIRVESDNSETCPDHLANNIELDMNGSNKSIEFGFQVSHYLLTRFVLEMETSHNTVDRMPMDGWVFT